MDELRPKQKAFVKEYLENGGNATQAVIDAGYDVDNRLTAGVIGAENLTKPNIRKALAEMIPDDLLTAKHIALLNKVDEKGEIDVQAVKAGVDMGYKLKGSFAPEKSINLNVQANVSDPRSLEIAKKYEEELKQGL